MAKSTRKNSSIEVPAQTSPISSLAPGPTLHNVVLSPYEQIEGRASTILNHVLQQSEPEKVQSGVTELDNVLKNLSECQKRVGQRRKEAGQHLSQLRQANPKGKPVEGEIRKFPDGRQLIFIGGTWSPYSDNAKTSSGPSPVN